MPMHSGWEKEEVVVQPTSKALRVIRETSSATMRLFCFPYAGSGPSVFNEWKALVPPTIDLIGVVYPGRESRATEPLVHDLQALTAPLAREIQYWTDKPFAFFGHSMGAYVCFELAKALAVRGVAPEHLFLSAAGAPHLPEPNRIHHLPSRDFLIEIVRLNGFPAEVLRSAELVKYALPILRADFTACENYQFKTGAPSRVPITVFGGSSDRRVDQDRLQAWKHHCGVSFSLRMFDGDHFYLRQNTRALVSCVTHSLAQAA